MWDTPVPIPNTTVKTANRPMVLHWRRCGRAGGRQIKKKNNSWKAPELNRHWKVESCRMKSKDFKIDAQLVYQ